MTVRPLLIVIIFLTQLSPGIRQCPGQDSSEPATGASSVEESGAKNSDRAANKSDTTANKEQPVHQNRLVNESSPYLLQHAHNPVDWYPWGEEAFAKAKSENKMIFLSVGYAACHWCHVMERESFVDPEIAAKLNERFVCIKVDREERPDVDQIYMTAVQMISGNGGWPMSVFLTPEGRPFWGGTYFPARDGDRGPTTGFLTVIKQIDAVWKTQRDKVLEQAVALTRAVDANQRAEPTESEQQPFDSALVERVLDSLSDQYDPVHGGFGSQARGPKFPEPSNLVFLLNRWESGSLDESQRNEAKRMALGSLDGMISGGMYDHLGGGFHRYSVDEKWQIPHFEKMLYDNGQLVSVYCEAYRRTGRQEYRQIVEATCDFVLRELTSPDGVFYSSLDADSEGEEGKFYRWTEQEISKYADVEGFDQFRSVYRLEGEPNFEGEFFVPDPGCTLTEFAKRESVNLSELYEKISSSRERMFQDRQERVRPLTDIKVLTGWNGLMIQGLADAGRILERKDYTAAALKAMRFLMQHSRSGDGRLLRTHAKGKASLNAYLDDYAFLAAGLIALHRSLDDERLLTIAATLTDKQIELFWDEQAGGFFFTSKDHPELIVRLKDPVDSAIPSGLSVTAENLLYLSRRGLDRDYSNRLKLTLQSITPLMRRAPAAATRAAAVMGELLESQVKP